MLPLLDCVAIGEKDQLVLRNCFNASGIDPDKIVRRDDGDEYDEARRTRDGFLTQFPEAIVYAYSALDVQIAVECGVIGGWKVTASGGRHTLLGVRDGSVVVDTSNMTDVGVVDNDAQTLTVGAG